MWNPSEHVSRWPAYDLPDNDEPRLLAIWNDEGGYLTTEEGEVIYYTDPENFIYWITENRVYLFVERLMTQKGLKEPFNDISRDERSRTYCTRTGGVVGIYIKSRYSSWIIDKRVWDYGESDSDSDFLRTIRLAYRFNGRYAATPGSLGERKLRETLPKGTKYSRPNTMLRTVLLSNKVGGRSDTVEEKKHYGELYEEDINGAYPDASCETIDPSEHHIRFGTTYSLISKEFLSKFFSYFVQATVSIPSTLRIKFGPLAVRDKDGRLHYPTQPGHIFEGWWWREELERAISAGMEVTVHHGYGWRHSSNWMMEWAVKMYKLRQSIGDEKVATLIKKEMVACIGRMGMAPEQLTLVDKEHRKDGDIPVIIPDANAFESSISDYYIHIEPDPDSNRLTHINSYIVMKTRCVLYDRIIAHMESENEVVASNYDAVYTRYPSKVSEKVGIELGYWKRHVISQAYIYGPRSIKGVRDGVPIDKRPGVKKKSRELSLSP